MRITLLTFLLMITAACPAPTRSSGDDDDSAGDDDDATGDDDDATGDDDDATEEAWWGFDNAAWRDANEDGVWVEGEDLWITVDMTELRGEDFNNYPMGILSTDNGGVAIENPDFTFFAIQANTTMEMSFAVRLGDADAAAPGVDFTVSAWALNCDTNDFVDCPPPNPFSFTVPL